MKNNQPQLHVTSTLMAQESITLNVISMNTKRIHTHCLVLVRGASRGFGRASGGLRASAAVVDCAVSLPASPGSWARAYAATGDPPAGPGGEGAIAQQGGKKATKGNLHPF